MVRGDGQHVRRSAEPSSSGGVPTAMNWKQAVFDAVGGVGGELEPPGCEVALDQLIEARLVDRDLAGLAGRSILAASTSTQRTWLPASARQAPVTRPT